MFNNSLGERYGEDRVIERSSNVLGLVNNNGNNIENDYKINSNNNINNQKYVIGENYQRM